MVIRTFMEWVDSEGLSSCTSNERDAYNAGVKEATAHFEEEKIKIHQYYAAELANLFEHEQVKGSESNGGKLT